MTFREKLAKEHPKQFWASTNKAIGCPYKYDYEKEPVDSYCTETNCTECWDREIPTEKTYEKGLQDAWELAIKLWLPSNYGGMDVDTVARIFGCDYCDISKKFTPQEALAKLKAYEEKQNEIKVGDVVYNDSSLEECTITHIDGNLIFGLYGDGSCGKVNRNDLKKTGRHIEIESLLGQIRGE